MTIIKTFLQKYAFPIILGIIAILAYGLFAFQHGYYWDDWGFSWSRAQLGVEGIFTQISVNRPIRAYWEAWLTPIIGFKPASWQIYLLFIRWAAALALWWILTTLWNEKRWQNTLTALFFLVYPGLTQIPLAVTYQYFWTQLFFFFISIVLMVQAIKSPRFRIPKTIIALIISLLSLFGLEYLFGLELTRPFFLWLAISPTLPSLKERIKKVSLFYAPYLALLLGYLYWRIFLYKSTIYAVGEISISVAGIWTQLWDAIPIVSLGAWQKVFMQPFSPEIGLSPRLVLVMGAILLAGTLLLANFLKSLVTYEVEASKKKKTDWDWLLLSLALMLGAGVPLYIANFPIKLTFPEDRFTFPYIFGVSMFLTWLLSLIKNEMQRFTLAALLISLAITTHIHNADIYRSEWRLQQLFAQQLFWRAPNITPGTLILAEDEGVFPHNDDEAFSFLVNWAYDTEPATSELKYDYFYISGRLGEELPTLEKGEPVYKDHLSATFTGNTNQILLLHFSPPSCLRILDPIYDKDVFIAPRDIENPNMGTLTLPRVLEAALPLSNPRDFIAKNNDDFNPPIWLFGEEPERSWCYYFEKADLARQVGDWEKVTKLGDIAFNIPYAPADSAEYLPFIEAYARLGRHEDAQLLTEIAVDKNPALRTTFCSLWQRLAMEGILGKSNAFLYEIQDFLGYCPTP
ncbi:MAG: hypothetical protein HN392_10830 [Anaerolineae bacterium]|nr:hypothetical protein [Anaerolineae bacterium]MBT7073407.1 hypothetical protein [Anaerolineae bacterium]